MEVLIGADPEVFVKDRKKRKFVCAHDMVKGTKEKPQKVKHGAVQVDGMALEFNIDPAKTEDEFVKNVDALKTKLRELIGPQYQISARSHVMFTPSVWKQAPEISKELGCDPDFNAWDNGNINPKPGTDLPMRTGAGHIHIGWGEDMPIEHPTHKEACLMLVKQLDCYVGMKSIYRDPDSTRRTLYGAAGAYRPKPYGVEYRVLSNYWVKRRTYMREVYRDVKFCVDMLEQGVRFYNLDYFRENDSRFNPRRLMRMSPDKFPYVTKYAEAATLYLDERYRN